MQARALGRRPAAVGAAEGEQVVLLFVAQQRHLERERRLGAEDLGEVLDRAPHVLERAQRDLARRRRVQQDLAARDVPHRVERRVAPVGRGEIDPLAADEPKPLVHVRRVRGLDPGEVLAHPALAQAPQVQLREPLAGGEVLLQAFDRAHLLVAVDPALALQHQPASLGHVLLLAALEARERRVVREPAARRAEVAERRARVLVVGREPQDPAQDALVLLHSLRGRAPQVQLPQVGHALTGGSPLLLELRVGLGGGRTRARASFGRIEAHLGHVGAAGVARAVAQELERARQAARERRLVLDPVHVDAQR